jgi:hypothetical protein
MHDALYENQPVLGPELIEALAQELKLDMERFESDVKSGRFRERVKHDFMGGVRSRAVPRLFSSMESVMTAAGMKPLFAPCRGQRQDKSLGKLKSFYSFLANHI